MSVSAASTIACFQLSCTGDSAADTIRVPIWTPSAPSANAAAMDRAVDDAAGGDDRNVDLGADEWQQHHRRHRGRALEAAALAPLDDEAVDAGIDRLLGCPQRGDDVVDGQPGLLECAVYLVGCPAEVVTNCTPWSMTNSTMPGSRTNAWAMLTPNGLVGEVAHLGDLVLDRVELAR